MKRIFKLEWSLARRKLIMGLMILLALISLSFIQEGIEKHNTVIKTIDTIQRYEQSKIPRYMNYLQYGTYGVRILLAPSPLSVFFINSSSISELTATADSGDRLKLYNSYKGRSIFTEKTGGFKDFSGIMLLFGSAFVLFLGYQTFLHKDYLRFMMAITGERSLFFTILFTRLTLIILFLCVTTFLSVVLLIINGISITGFEYRYLVIYFAVLIPVWIFFFMIGTLASSLKSRFTGPFVLILTWFSLVFIIPSLINSYTYLQAEKIENEISMENNTFNILMDVEKKIRQKVGQINENNKDAIWKEVSKHLDKEIKQIQVMEQTMEKDIQKKAGIHQKLSIWVPSAFYLSTGNEISSKGYINYIGFYRYVQELKFKFIPYIMEKHFGSIFDSKTRNKKTQIESFLTNNKEIFKAEPVLPLYFHWGVLLMFLYILILTVLSYYGFKKSLRL
jgi:hypothetical protein